MLINKFIKDLSKIKRIYIISNRYISIGMEPHNFNGEIVYSRWYFSDYGTCWNAGRKDLDYAPFPIYNRNLTENMCIRNAIRMIKKGHPNIIKIPNKYCVFFNRDNWISYLEY